MRYMHRSGGMALVLCLAAAGGPGAAQEEAPREFILEYVDTGLDYNFGSSRGNVEVVFRKEPEYAGDQVYRGVIQLSDSPGDFVGMAFDAVGEVLYVDRNRNLDLTDDGPPVAAETVHRVGIADFQNIPIDVPHGEISVRHNFYVYFNGDYYYSYTQSGWRGEVDLDGTPCVVSVSDNLDGVFDGRDRFWLDHERNREARLSCGAESPMRLPGWLHIDGRNYRVAFELRAGEDGPVVAMQVTPLTDDLMEITFEGQFVSRIVLSGEDNAYGVLEWPAKSLRIPRGTHNPVGVHVLDSYSGLIRQVVALVEGGNTHLVAGGPLRQVVSAERSGNFLVMDYALRGLNDVEYHPKTFQRDNLARFKVFKGDRVLAQDQFEYG